MRALRRRTSLCAVLVLFASSSSRLVLVRPKCPRCRLRVGRTRWTSGGLLAARRVSFAHRATRPDRPRRRPRTSSTCADSSSPSPSGSSSCGTADSAPSSASWRAPIGTACTTNRTRRSTRTPAHDTPRTGTPASNPQHRHREQRAHGGHFPHLDLGARGPRTNTCRRTHAGHHAPLLPVDFLQIFFCNHGFAIFFCNPHV